MQGKTLSPPCAPNSTDIQGRFYSIKGPDANGVSSASGPLDFSYLILKRQALRRNAAGNDIMAGIIRRYADMGGTRRNTQSVALLSAD